MNFKFWQFWQCTANLPKIMAARVHLTDSPLPSLSFHLICKLAFCTSERVLRSSRKPIAHFRVALSLLFKPRPSANPIIWMQLKSARERNINGFTFGLGSKRRLRATRKWAIESNHYYIACFRDLDDFYEVSS